MNEELKSIAKEYIEKVNEVCLLMLKGLNLKTKSDLWKYRSLHPELMYGFEISGNRYMFHGIGCRVSNQDTTIIDWDFGYGSRWCGINPWLFAYYVKANYENLIEYHDGFYIEKECEEAVLRGDMVKKDGLYYFKIPDIETFEPDFPKEFDTLVIDQNDSRWTIKRNKMVDRFIRKSKRVSKRVGEGTDTFILSFILNDRKIFSIPFDDIGYPKKAVEIMKELMQQANH